MWKKGFDTKRKMLKLEKQQQHPCYFFKNENENYAFLVPPSECF